MITREEKRYTTAIITLAFILMVILCVREFTTPYLLYRISLRTGIYFRPYMWKPVQPWNMHTYRGYGDEGGAAYQFRDILKTIAKVDGIVLAITIVLIAHSLYHRIERKYITRNPSTTPAKCGGLQKP